MIKRSDWQIVGRWLGKYLILNVIIVTNVALLCSVYLADTILISDNNEELKIEFSADDSHHFSPLIGLLSDWSKAPILSSDWLMMISVPGECQHTTEAPQDLQTKL